MTQGKKRIDTVVAATSAPASGGTVGASAAARAGQESTCEAVLKSVIGLAQATLREQGQGRTVAAEETRARAGTESSVEVADSGAPTAQQQLARALRDLEPEMALKLRTLMVAGRDGQGVHSVKVNMTLGDSASAFDAAAHDSSENGPLLAEYLRRGHALACAAGLDLERPIAGWAAAEQNLDERAWLSFGRQLAQSQPDDWQCLSYAAAGTQQINKLFLRLGDNAWWSFQTLLDRPSLAEVAKQKRALTRRRSKGVSVSSLKALAPQLQASEGRALRRAARAICARVGDSAETR